MEPKIGDVWTGEDNLGNKTEHRVTQVDHFTIWRDHAKIILISLDDEPLAHIEWWFGQGYYPPE